MGGGLAIVVKEWRTWGIARKSASRQGGVPVGSAAFVYYGFWLMRAAPVFCSSEKDGMGNCGAFEGYDD